jgi:subfamily B ATP-binding cassette protein MsbA
MGVLGNSKIGSTLKALIRGKINPIYLRFYPYFRPHLPFIAVSVALSLVVSASGAVLPWSLKRLVDQLSVQNYSSNLLLWMMIIPILIITFDLLRFFQEYLMTQVNLQLEIHLRLSLLNSIFRKKMSFVKEKHSGELISLINNDLKIAQFIPEMLIRIFIEFPLSIAIALATMFYLDFVLASFVLVNAPIVYFLLRKVRDLRRRIAREKMRLTAIIMRDFQEFISSIKIVKIWGLASFCCEKFSRDARAYLQQSIREVKFNYLTRGLIGVLAAVMLNLIIYLILQRMKSEAATIGNYAGFMFALWLFLQPLKQITQGYSNLLNATVAAERVLEILDGGQWNEKNIDTGLQVPTIKKIEFKNASFAYNGHTVLRDVNIVFEPSRFYLIVGANGAGKTTLIESLVGFLDPVSGEILINDRSLSLYNMTSLRGRISYVPQEINLFGLSVRDNVVLSHSSLKPEKEARYRWSLQTALFKDTLERSARDDSAMVAERGANFSGGERQRLSIARALFKTYDLLILDEANANLSSSSCETIMDNIDQEKEGKIIILITHDERYSRFADVIYEVDNQKILRRFL